MCVDTTVMLKGISVHWKSRIRSIFYLFSSLTFFAVAGAAAEDNPAAKPYRKQQIADSRFGQGVNQDLLQKAYTLRQTIDQSVVGQDRAARALQDRLIQYLENYGSRDKDPIAMHLVGLPGVGKSSILDSLEKLGINVVRVDAQRFVGQNVQNEMRDLSNQLANVANQKSPAIILFDELDKVPEVLRKGGELAEESNPLVGLFNQIMTDGKVALNGYRLDLSNTFVMSAMNFSPQEIENFSKNALGVKKNFYDFSVDDFAKFDEWIRSSPNARSQVLSHLFRSNTVSRLAPNTVIVKPLSNEDYRKIAKLNVDSTVQKVTGGIHKDKRISVAYTDKYIDFLTQHTVFPPSGARDTIVKSNALTEQLISFGTKASPFDDKSLNQPRSIILDVDQAGQIKVTVTPKLRRSQGTVVDGKSFSFPVEFDFEDRTFYRPDIVSASPPPAIVSSRSTMQKGLTRKEVYNTRFPKGGDQARGLAEQVDKSVIGQQPYTQHLENEIGAFLSRSEAVTKNPPFTVFAGFPGIGKSEMVAIAARAANLPIVRVNLQNYSSDAPDVGDRLIYELMNQIGVVKSKRPDGKFLLQIEELDKIFETDPTNGAIRNRPAMTIIKDLLNDGIIQGRITLAGTGSYNYEIDIRNAYTAMTMNFAVDRFGFKADPRLTSIEDVTTAWKRLSTRPADLKKVLGTMFLPETVNRLMPKIKIVKPLDQKSYSQIIDNQVATAALERLYDQTTGVNKGEIELKLSPAYKKYLYDETVIPSEGGRYTAVSSRGRISSDLEEALKHLPRSSKLATQPLEITLDFDPEKSAVSAVAKSTRPGSTAKPKKIFEQLVSLSFPPLDAHGTIPEERVLTAVHEFGHAFTAVRMGKRFEYATVVPPEVGVGGYVKFKPSPQGAKDLIATIYSTLGSRAMERIFLSPDPLSSHSVIEITAGASNDIKQATRAIWDVMFEYGLDPFGGVIERQGVDGGARYAAFADLPAEKVEQLARIMKDMEDYLVQDLLSAHPKEWYRDKITDFARAGGLEEREFYALIGFPYPGENAIPVGTRTALQDTFEGTIKKPEKSTQEAAAFRQGLTKSNAKANLDRATDEAIGSMKRRLHVDSKRLEEIVNDEVVGKSCAGQFQNLPLK